jgi:opacity protein-like surface antigen
MRLSWTSGPIAAAIALEDNNSSFSSNNNLGVAGELKFSGDMISGEISGGAWDSASSDWRVGAGLGFNMDMFKVGVSAGLGKQNGVKFEKANILMSANLSDAVHGEVGFNWVNTNAGTDSVAALAGIYYDPVDKLTIGLEAEWINPQGSSNTSTQVDLVTVYKF